MLNLEIISNVLLALGTLGLAVYCLVLARRLQKFNDLDSGIGQTLSVFSAQVDTLTKHLESTQNVANGSVLALTGITDRADNASKRLELLVASLNDLTSADAPIVHPNPTPQSLHDIAGDIPKFQSNRSILKVPN
jgi:hypothetical protein